MKTEVEVDMEVKNIWKEYSEGLLKFRIIGKWR